MGGRLPSDAKQNVYHAIALSLSTQCVTDG